MTFTQSIKSEVLKIKGAKKCCSRAQLYGMMLFSPHFEEGRIGFSSGSIEVCEKAKQLFSSAFPKLRSECRSSGDTEYHFEVAGEDTGKVFESFGYPDSSTYRLLLENMHCEECRPAFLRGVFLLCGSAVSPENSYHLEMVVSRYTLSLELQRYLKICGFSAKLTERNSHYVVYFKDSNEIIDFIAYIGAHQSSFDMTDRMIEKNIRNNCNRVSNCETANIKRVVSASHRQKEAINGLTKLGILSSLPEEYAETARLRLENDDASLSELAAMHEPPVTKSCLNRRLAKICELWEEKRN